MKALRKSFELQYANYRGVHADRLEVCPICLEPIRHFHIVTVCTHGRTSHAVHRKCAQHWYTDSSKKCASCGQPCENKYTALAYYLRVIASLTVNRETNKNVEVMDSLKIIGRTILGIHKSKGVNVSPMLSIGTSRRIPSQTAEIDISIGHALFNRIFIPAELEDQHWGLSQDPVSGTLVLVIQDGVSTLATQVEAMARKPIKIISITQMMTGIQYPRYTKDKTLFKEDPYCAIELNGAYYSLEFTIFELERESQTQNVYTNEGLEELEGDADVKSYLNSLALGNFELRTPYSETAMAVDSGDKPKL